MPYLARINFPCLANAELAHGNALAVEHAVDVVVRKNEQLRRIGKRLIFRKPCCLGVAMRADDWQVPYGCVKATRNRARFRISGEKPVRMQNGQCVRLHEYVSSTILRQKHVVRPL